MSFEKIFRQKKKHFIVLLRDQNTLPTSSFNCLETQKGNFLSWFHLKLTAWGEKIRGLYCLQNLWAAMYSRAVQGFHRLSPGTFGNTSPQRTWLWFLAVLFLTRGLTCSRLCKPEAPSYACLLGSSAQALSPVSLCCICLSRWRR